MEPQIVSAKNRSVPVRLYRPTAITNSNNAPCVLFMHGGGWALGSIDTHDCITAELAHKTGAVVVSVDYRLAPEHTYPAGLEDCQAVLQHLQQHGGGWGVDPERIVVAGDSSGGNLAAALAIWQRDVGDTSLRGQALLYPVLGTDFSTTSYTENANAPMLTRQTMMFFWDLYLAGETHLANGLAAPLHADDFSRLPPAVIMTARYDPVRDDGAAYSACLTSAGVLATYRCAPDLPHGFLRARGMSPSSAQEFEFFCDSVRQLLGIDARRPDGASRETHRLL